MKRYLWKGVVVVVVMVGLVAAAQPALAWVRIGVNVRVPFPVVVTPVGAVVGAPVVHARPRAIYYQPVWIPGHFNRWGAWVPGHWR
jgi:hypothetical protein